MTGAIDGDDGWLIVDQDGRLMCGGHLRIYAIAWFVLMVTKGNNCCGSPDAVRDQCVHRMNFFIVLHGFTIELIYGISEIDDHTTLPARDLFNSNSNSNRINSRNNV